MEKSDNINCKYTVDQMPSTSPERTERVPQTDKSSSNVAPNPLAVHTEKDVDITSCASTGVNDPSASAVNIETVSPTQSDGCKSITNQNPSTSAAKTQCNRFKILHSCHKCGDYFKTAADLTRHRKNHARQKKFTCQLCHKQFTQFIGLNRHMLTHTGEKPFQCKTCGKRFSQSSNLNKHSRSHTGEKPYKCETCDKCFNDPSNLKRHMKRHKRKVDERTDSDVETEDSKSTIDNRISTSAAETQSPSLFNLLKSKGKKPRAHRCRKCGECFKSTAKLFWHNITDHAEQKEYVCLECGKIFTQSANLTTHMRTHTGDKPFQCKTCGKRFRQSGNLKRHSLSHTGEKPYKCETCGRCFNNSGTLKKHSDRHAGRKPHTCQTCGRSFNEKSDLKRHVRIHTGEKPYKCNECGRCFDRSCSLKRHSRTHTGEKPDVKCQTTGKSVPGKGDLKRDMETQDLYVYQYVHECQECNKLFKTAGYLRKHCRRNHSSSQKK